MNQPTKMTGPTCMSIGTYIVSETGGGRGASNQEFKGIADSQILLPSPQPPLPPQKKIKKKGKILLKNGKVVPPSLIVLAIYVPGTTVALVQICRMLFLMVWYPKSSSPYGDIGCGSMAAKTRIFTRSSFMIFLSYSNTFTNCKRKTYM